ncbi:endo-1,4-beta-xylanase 5-like isoform X1 [Beta vulgaris subsp. vulgaris]|uniref:endo-1,4-beta-xylanase 5-like isoform X1 n=1 Tax=Beta vulgaris subsp. vulgaris TaxID=3555 RepID=UPI002036BD78|nr:endo-1,4-beta-xylanase 5-like isoform X1 [Beta vulgaris subsp. vulgaris]
MKITFLLWHPFFLLFLANAGDTIQALTYDYSATTECLKEAWKAQYGGGIIQNPEFDNGIERWTNFGHGNIKERITSNGNKYIVAINRTQPSDGPSQRVQLIKGKLYAFSAWIQISEGSEIIAVKFRSPTGKFLHGGTVIAEQGCWSMLKGGIVATFSGPVDLTFETNNTSVEVWVDNVSLQPFTKKQWRLHQETTISKVRKQKVKFQVRNKDNTSLAGATITLKQIKSSFPIGCEINEFILNNTKYRNWFASRFSVTAFGNEMKWYFTEKKAVGRENYTIPDAMLQFCEQNNIDVRGHNIFWDDPKYQPTWLTTKIASKKLKKLVEKRLKSVVSRYKGRLIHWDVMNENLHFSYFEDKLGKNASAEIFSRTYELDQKPILFMNDYNTIEVSEDEASMPAKYARKLKNIVSFYREMNGGNKIIPVGIGLESRFAPGQPNFAYMRAGMDYLASMGFPVWLTEVFVDKGENQAQYLEEVLREGYSHPAVKGIVIWPTSPFSKKCKMCLIDVDKHYMNTPTGDVIDKLIAELWSSKPLNISSNEQGFSEVVLLLGDYEVIVKYPATNSCTKLKLKVTEKSTNFVYVHVHGNVCVPNDND